MNKEDIHRQEYGNELAISSEDTYDPLVEEDVEEKDADEIAETIGYIGNPEELVARTETPAVPPKSSDEKINNLFENMKPFRLKFLRILSFCKEPRSFEQLEEYVGELHINRRTIYTAANYCQMLENVEALARITEDGTLYDEVEIEPVELERDGQIFIEPGAPPLAFWQTTEAGRRVVENDEPLDTLHEIFEKEAKYKVVFEQLLEFCNRTEGVSIDEIKQTINKNPVLEYPAKTAQFFMDYLERNSALVWDETWKTSALGSLVLDLIQTEGEMK